MSDLTKMAREAAGKVALIQVMELSALAMEGLELTERAAKRISDKVTTVGAQVVIEMVQAVIAELEAENQRLRATIDMLADQLAADQLAAEFAPMVIPEAIPGDKI